MTTTTLSVVTDDTDPPADSIATATETGATESSADGTDESVTATAPPANARAQYLDPNDLVIGENVRVSFDLDDHPAEAESIRRFGVRNPILAEHGHDGYVHVIDGQVRTLIARAVGATQVPVWVTDAPTDISDNERRIARTLDQINLNDRRIPLSEADRAAGVALMLDLGASATRIAHGLQRTRSEIRRAATIGRSATAKQLLDDGQYTLKQLAVIADYEAAGDTDAVQELTRATRYQFGYVARRIADDRTETRDRLHAALPYAATGFGILTREPDIGSEQAVFVPAADLTTTDRSPVDQEHIYADPSRWVVLLEVEENAELVDIDSGDLVDSDTVDWDTEHDSDAAAGEGLRHVDTVRWRDRWTPTHYLLADRLPDSGFTLATPPDTSDEQVRAVVAAEATAREAARQDYRRVRELNKRGAAAKQRREEFLTEYLTRRTPPTQAAGFVATYLAGQLDTPTVQLVTTILGVGNSRQELQAAITDTPVNRVWVIVLAMVLATHEAPIDKSFWRATSSTTTSYLHLLAEIAADAGSDFALVDVEQAAAGEIDYHDIDLAA
ncbi:ParB N-terminal domain-containing protein [Nocardia cyriacigeorgica]|uniref:ParB/RepB/Spo0J family partition protein n=1 Tax=Nocardia cyriacigeorgica TaxID=135487 RepID=UPI0018959582|nr:ParB N-terminal domain-containing protein [Nocardia cyriacigeorgica]MBF6102256.1 ParB N-terminal domain-containing protein [Nocardia cyriacigeorgica]